MPVTNIDKVRRVVSAPLLTAEPLDPRVRLINHVSADFGVGIQVQISINVTRWDACCTQSIKGEVRRVLQGILPPELTSAQVQGAAHSAITPRFLRLRVVLAVSFARIHWQNLANFSGLALEFVNAADHDRIQRDDVLVLVGIRDALLAEFEITVLNKTRDEDYAARHRLSTCSTRS